MSADFTAELLLRYYREPERFRGEARRRDAPPVDSEVILKLALGRRIEFADPALNDAGAVKALQAAAATYVREVFFRPDATPYQMLGLAPGASAQAIKESFRLLMQLVHPDRQDSGEAWPDSFAALANRAYGILRDQHARAAYDRDADARARVARAVYRTAAAREASLMPVVLWPARPGGRGPWGTQLPEWLTAGVGGFVRAHPAVAAFALLAVGAAVVIALSLRAGPEEMLMREAQEVLSPVTPTAPATAHASREPVDAVASAAPAIAATSPTMPADAARVTGNDVATVVRATAAAPAVAGHAPAVPPAPLIRAASGVPDVPKTPSAPAAPPSAVAVPAPPPVSASALPPAAAPASPPVAAPAPPPVAVATPLPPAATATPPAAALSPLPVALASAPSAPTPPAVPATAPATPEIEALFAAFVEAYEHGRPDAFAALFDDDADTNLRHGRAAIRSEYDELFRLSNWRRIQLTRINWRRAGDRAYAKGEMAVKIGWRDGREVEQRVAVDMELVRRDGRAVIARLSHQPKSP